MIKPKLIKAADTVHLCLKKLDLGEKMLLNQLLFIIKNMKLNDVSGVHINN